MRKEQESKVMKLRKGRVWPSGMFLVLSLGVAILGIAVFASVILGYFQQERIMAAYQSMSYVINLIEREDTMAEQSAVLDDLNRSGVLKDAVFILDARGEPLQNVGEPTYQLGKVDEFAYSSDRSVWLYGDDQNVYKLVDQSNNLNLTYMTSFCKETIANPESVFDLQKRKEVIEKHYYWFGVQLPGERLLLMRNSVSFYRGDLLLIVFVGAICTIMMLLPCVFMFINMLINLANQHRTTTLLYTDNVTEGKSWMHFEHYGNRAIQTGLHSRYFYYAVVEVSLMKYRSFCTCHGLKEGEALLANVDKALCSRLKRGEYCAHFGKSSFALLLRCTSDHAACVERVDVLLRELGQDIHRESMVFHAGICFVEPKKKREQAAGKEGKLLDIQEYYNQASAARASIEDEKQIAVAVFDNKLLERHLWEHRVSEKMEAALQHEEFKVFIQPKYNPLTNELSGGEALVRWINKEDGFVSPGRFIPIFEENGFITKLDDYMISHVAKLQAKWIAEGKRVVPISVNVSRAHFATPDLADHICRMVDAYQVPHHLLEIELTESAFFDDQEALVKTVRELKEKGFDISMDDFGAGYSSLNSLKDLPLDVLKLDAGFFRGEGGAERGEIVVSQAIRLAKQLNMRIVAEGVEKQNQVDFLAANDCDMIQGYYYAKPMPANEYEERLQTVVA